MSRQFIAIVFACVLVIGGCSNDAPEKAIVQQKAAPPSTNVTGRGGAKAGERAVRIVDSPIIGIWTRTDGNQKAILAVDEGNTYEFVDETNPDGSHKGTYLFMGKRLSLRPTDIGSPGAQEKISGRFINLKIGKNQKSLESADPSWPAKFAKK